MGDVRSDLREEGGKNRGPKIDLMNLEVGLQFGSPYCAAAVSHCFRRCWISGQRFPYAGGSQFLRKWFAERNLFSTDAQALLGWRGALFGWTNSGGKHGHIGFVARRLTDGSGRVVAIQTAEYNTSPAGSRDGDGAYSLRRMAPIDGGYRLWFLNTSSICGGRWWR